MLKAADRGVRVRILLDDTTSDGLDPSSPRWRRIRRFRFVFQSAASGRSTGVTRTAGRLFNLSQQHRRMHNKLWLADNSVAIVGGRNLGDEYFDAEPNLNFTDIDMLSVGPVAEQLGTQFRSILEQCSEQADRRNFSSKPSARDLQNTRTRLEESLEETRKQNHALYQQLMTFTTQPRMDIWRKELIWAWNQALWDAPSKVLAKGEPNPQLLLTTQLAPELNNVTKELIMISAYFVPGQPGLVYLTGRADAGVSVSC
jgi:putative cardiolipin synthase